MNKILNVVLLCLAMNTLCGYSQDNYLKHTVLKGETVTQIAEKYKVTPYDIYTLNPDAKAGIKEHAILLIPKKQVGEVTPKSQPKPLANGKKHIVQPKETLFSLSKKYDVKIDELKAWNPEIESKGLQIGMEITVSKTEDIPPAKKLPIVEDKKKTVVEEKKKSPDVHTHKVEAKETIYSLTKKYKISEADFRNWNPDVVKNGLQIGMEVAVSQEGTRLITKKTEPKPTETLVTTIPEPDRPYLKHTVSSGESILRIAQRYSVKISELYNLNPFLEDGLKIGDVLRIRPLTDEETTALKKEEAKDPKRQKELEKERLEREKAEKLEKERIAKEKAEAEKAEKERIAREKSEAKLRAKEEKERQKQEANKVEKQLPPPIESEQYYTVKPKETLYSIAKQFDTSEEELIKYNPELVNGLKRGMTVKIPPKGGVYVKRQKTDLYRNADLNTRKELVILLPYVPASVEVDSTGAEIQTAPNKYSKHNKFLNMTLDFYSGVLMAVDSAKVLKLPISVKILEVETTKNSSNVAQVVRGNNFVGADAVIGPFHNAHTEIVAQLLGQYNVPVISPLSKAMSKPIPNLFNAIPTQPDIYDAMLDYMYAKNGNVVAVVSGKKNSTKDYLTTNHPKIKYPDMGGRSYLSYDAMRQQLVAGQKNFVILESENAGQVMNVTNLLRKLQSEFDIQLAVFELYDALDFEEVSVQNLISLKLMFPSVTRVVEGEQNNPLVKKFKQTIGVEPNYYVSKGFDVTFDTMLRICQSEGFASSTRNYQSEGFENKFNYVDKNGVKINNAVYIQYYDTDYTIKLAE